MTSHFDFIKRSLSLKTLSATKASVKICDWLNLGDYEISKEISSQTIFSLGNYSGSVASCFATEARSFYSASVESLAHAREHPSLSKKSVCWNLVELYYCAFYAAHAFLRLCGKSLSYIPKTNKIEKMYKSYFGSDISLQSGYYSVIYTDSLDILEFYKLDMSASEGSHQKLWKLFDTLLFSIYNLEDLDSTSHQTAQFEIEQIQDRLKNKNPQSGAKPGWLSTVRNNINYKLDYGVWFPYSGFKHHSCILNLINSTTFRESSKQIDSKDEVISFAATCVTIFHLVSATLNNLKPVCPSKSIIVDSRNFIEISSLTEKQ